jgi:hypothetical protein
MAENESDAGTDEMGTPYTDRSVVLCRTCMRPLTWETRTEPGYLPRTGWYDDARSDPLVCFKAVDYRHVPLTAREWAYYEAGQRSVAEEAPATDPYDNHDRRILEDADAGLVDKQIVVVRCPHRIGLAYQGSPAPGMEDDWLMRLPCPCNDRSEVVATIEPIEEGCDCTELCEMGPTCPGGMLAGLPGSGCSRTRVLPPAKTDGAS